MDASRGKGKARARNDMADPDGPFQVRLPGPRVAAPKCWKRLGTSARSAPYESPWAATAGLAPTPLTPLTLWQSEDRNPLCSNRFDKRIRVCSLPVAHDVFGIWSLRCSLVRHRWPD